MPRPDEVERLIIRPPRPRSDAELATKVLIIARTSPSSPRTLKPLVRELGHEVLEVAATRTEAVEAIGRAKPGLVLADIQLADGSSGIDAVKDILGTFRCARDFHHGLPRAPAHTANGPSRPS